MLWKSLQQVSWSRNILRHPSQRGQPKQSPFPKLKGPPLQTLPDISTAKHKLKSCSVLQVGPFVGPDEGCFVGRGVGRGEGCFVGCGVYSFDGVPVGLELSKAAGHAVPSPKTTCFSVLLALLSSSLDATTLSP